MRRFQQVDVFSPEPLRGNPVAVVVDAEGLSTEQMQAFTRWTNLSEATFLLPPSTAEADYRVRIFTAAGELPFAGHPTLGSCHAWLRAGGQPGHEEHIVQECGAGLVPIRRDGRATGVPRAGAAPLGPRRGGGPGTRRPRPGHQPRGHHRQPVGGQRSGLGGGHAGISGGRPGRLARGARR